MRKNKILLITSRSTTNSIQDSLAIPYGLYILKNHLNKNGVDCDVLDLDFKSESECINAVKNNNYDIIGISVTHWNMASDLDFLHTLKKIVKEMNKKTLFIAGGFSATLNSKEWLKCGFDLICVGYAEDALLKICENYSPDQNRKQLISFIKNIDGVAIQDENKNLIFKHSKPLTEKEFENKMFTLAMSMEIPYEEYWDFMRKRASGILSINKRSYVIENSRIYTSSKCLANCGYCCCPAFLSKAQNSSANLYMLSAKQIYELVIFHIRKYGARAFSINDDDFIIGNEAGNKRVTDFCDLIIEGKKKGEIPEEIKFSCQTRATDFIIKEGNKKIVNLPLIKKMAEAKFHNVSLGIETFSERLIKSPSINKPRAKSQDYHDVLQAMINSNLYPTINLIFGIPEEKPEELIETIQQTMKYIDKPCQISVATKLLAFPGSPLWNSKDYPTEDVVWENPETKEKIKIPIYYTPKDKQLSELIVRLEDDKIIEMANLRKKYNLNEYQFLPRIAIALCVFKIASKFLGYNDLYDQISQKLDELITGTFTKCME
ncbi:B12 binding domain protein [uncultured archaeon]|nr:B12 binding domain protein [uncultured archaeon]